MVGTTGMTSATERYFEAARQVLPGGVTAAARVHGGIGRPIAFARGEGSRLIDVDGREYVDMLTGFGASLLGHGHPAVRSAVEEALARGVLCAHELPEHEQVARLLAELVPCAEQVRFTTSGTETTWHAIRTARAYTGKNVVVKFEGHFHGYHDYLGYSSWPPLDEAGPPDAPIARPESGGIPPELKQFVVVLPFNDVDVLERTLRRRAGEIAAVILEPVNLNSGGVRPRPGFLEALRALTRDLGIVLIFDEILSGFRTGSSCAQGFFGVTPDMATLGKALGGGIPLSAFVGTREVMGAVAPLGGAVHSGTFNAHPIAILAARAFLDLARQESFWEHLDSLAQRLYADLPGIFERVGVPCQVQTFGNRFNLNFGLETEPTNYREAARYDRALAARFFAAALDHGVYFHTLWHAGFSAAHTLADIDRALEGIEAAAREVARTA